MWKQRSSIKLCTYTILQSEDQTLSIVQISKTHWVVGDFKCTPQSFDFKETLSHNYKQFGNLNHSFTGLSYSKDKKWPKMQHCRTKAHLCKRRVWEWLWNGKHESQRKHTSWNWLLNGKDQPSVCLLPTVGSWERKCLFHVALTCQWKSAVDMRLLDLKMCWEGGILPQEITMFQETSAFIKWVTFYC